MEVPNASHRKDKIMKPTIQFIPKSRCGSSDREFRHGSAFPQTDYCYQGASMASRGGRCFGVRQASFRSISQDYFKNEAPQTFAGEATLFTVIFVTAVVPIINSASALLHLVRSFGSL
jgi:hypothetical protein